MRSVLHCLVKALDRGWEGLRTPLSGLRYRAKPLAARHEREHTNGLLRQYFPKGTDLSRWSAKRGRSRRCGAERTAPQDARLEDSRRGPRRAPALCSTSRCCVDYLSLVNTRPGPSARMSEPPAWPARSEPSATLSTTPQSSPSGPACRRAAQHQEVEHPRRVVRSDLRLDRGLTTEPVDTARWG